MPDFYREKIILAAKTRLKVVNDSSSHAKKSVSKSSQIREDGQHRVSDECKGDSAEEPDSCSNHEGRNLNHPPVIANAFPSAPPAPPALPEPPAPLPQLHALNTFLNYHLISIIDDSEASTTYKAKMLSGERFYSLKIHKSKLSQEDALKFTQRNRLLTQLDHANLISLYDVGVLPDGTPYMVSELVEGMTLEQLITEQGSLPLDMFFDIFSQLCSALQFCHERNLIHGHLSPSTVRLMRSESGGFSVKLESSPAWSELEFEMDYSSFDFAEKNIPESIVRNLTYRSPEHFLGRVGRSADTYAVGAMMYRAASGRPPLQSDDPLKMLLKIANVMPAKLADIPGLLVSPELQRIIMSALEKDPCKRPFSMTELADDLACASGVKKRSNRQALLIALRMMVRPKVGPDNKPQQDRMGQILVAVTALSILGACVLAHDANFGVATSLGRQQSYIDKGDVGVMRHDFQKAAYFWRLALAEAERRGPTQAELGALYARAGDAVLTDVQASFMTIPGSAVSLPACGFGPAGLSILSPEEMLRLSAAEEFYDKAVEHLNKAGKLNTGMEQLDRLIDLKRAKKDNVACERLLKLRISTAAPTGALSRYNLRATQELAKYYEDQGNLKESARFYERAMAIQDLPRSYFEYEDYSTYQRLETNYAMVLAKLNRFPEAETVCRECLKKQVLDRRDFTTALDVMRDFANICAKNGHLQRANAIRDKVRVLEKRPPYKESEWLDF